MPEKAGAIRIEGGTTMTCARRGRRVEEYDCSLGTVTKPSAN